MIQIEHKISGERQNVASMTGYEASEWAQVATLPASAAGDLSLYGAGTGVAARGVEDLDRVKATLIAQVKVANETLVRSTYSTNYGKQKKYSRKQQEVMDFRGLAPTVTSLSTTLTQSLSVVAPVFDLLTATAQKKKFRFAMAEAAKRGVTVATVIGEFEAAIENVESMVASWEATEQDAVRRIKAATTAAAARAIFAGIDWTFRAP